jgi:glycosyltransferase involved in cell wall biosynthesis
LNNKQKHIVFITPGFTSNQNDDTNIPALQIYTKKLQEQKDVKISIITLNFPYTKKPYQWYNCKVYPLNLGNKRNYLFFLNRSVQKQLLSLHKEYKIDVLHSFWLGECAFWASKFSKKHQIKHITTLMGQDAKKGNKFVKILPLKKLNLVSLSDFQQQLFYKNYHINSEQISWGIDKNSIPKPTKKSIDIIGIGSLIPLKKYSEFIASVHLIKAFKPDVNAVLIGGGTLKQQLLNQIKDLKLSKNITLTGQISYKKTQELLSESKVLLHTSNYESFGMIFAEALANNVAIVSREVGIAKESNFWKIANSPKEFALQCQVFLKEKHPLIPSFPKIEATLTAYLKLYDL